jgi:hypothetical protein
MAGTSIVRDTRFTACFTGGTMADCPCTDTDAQKAAFASDAVSYLKHRKEMETTINMSFKNNIANHPNQIMTRKVDLPLLAFAELK